MAVAHAGVMDAAIAVTDELVRHKMGLDAFMFDRQFAWIVLQRHFQNVVNSHLYFDLFQHYKHPC
jgi:hypothetical protein